MKIVQYQCATSSGGDNKYKTTFDLLDYDLHGIVLAKLATWVMSHSCGKSFSASHLTVRITLECLQLFSNQPSNRSDRAELLIQPAAGKCQVLYFCIFMVYVFQQTLRKHAYSNILKILPPKTGSFRIKKSDIFHISAQNIDCGYSLEPPRRGCSNEYHNLCFEQK